MALIKVKPTSPGRRAVVKVVNPNLYKGRPHDALVERKTKTAGRNNTGQITTRHMGGGHKQHYRVIDFKRDKDGIPAKVERIEHDPNRSAHIALLCYADGERRYIIACKGLAVGAQLQNGSDSPIKPGNAMPLRNIPVGSTIHCVEMMPGKGAQLARAAGGAVQLLAREGEYAQLRLRSGEIRKVHEQCFATIGQVGNAQWENVVLGKAGRARHLGIRPMSRGMVRNPVDHPNGGGQGKSKGGGGRQHLTSPWGVLAKGYRTRNKHKISNRFILVRRDGRPMKLK